ncbi:MAG: type IX secretion system protein PorQ [Sphingobacteriales bacterium]|nr:MAG: type IX secretion system protein PorQ [Sphingobacteriales bacterium]
MPRFKMMQWRKWSSLLLLGICCHTAQAQVTGGRFAMEYLRMPNSPHVSALGGMSVANPGQDISFALQNPSMMRPGLHNQLGLNYNAYYAGVGVANLQYGYHVPDVNTSFALGVQYLNYGSFTQTDAIGNEFGDFQARDYAITLAASRQYKEKWRYGAALKFAHSSLYDKNAAGILADVGITYNDTASLLTIGAVAKNIGFMVNKYNPANSSEPLPFDLQIGISKRFQHIPLRLMATVHHLYEWDVRYNNPEDVQNTNLFGSSDSTTSEKSYFVDKLFRHFVFAAEITVAKRLTVTAAYNHLRRGELALKERTATAGFSFGLGLNLNKFQVHYARSFYHLAGPYNEIGINMQLNKLFNTGKWGERVHWSDSYQDWQ